ncbi:hypothetical protein [Hyphomicrobium sp. DY-1]|uniref:hypothetical protein n=1 Tax=Hyphomicrobium sp. DY-1 TaxID=3075650 RepID=UPI0039C3597B
MSIDKDGGAAYPVIPPLDPEVPGSASGYPYPSSGMTLRDYFAAQALPSLVLACGNDTLIDGETLEKHVSRLAYDLASAMLKAREGKS